MSTRLAVVGAGAAGTAAAWLAARRGAEVTLFSAHAGSTSLAAGALDDGAFGPDADVLSFVAALGVWQIASCVIATRQGVLRRVAGRDSSLLDLAPLAGRRVAVADVERDDWDGAALAAALGDSAWAQETRTEFSAVPVPACRRGAERRISAFDFARLHDHPERMGWLRGLLAERSEGFDGWLVGPWLGIEPGAADGLRAGLRLPVGEVTSPPGGAAGARFDAARERLLAETAVKRRSERVERIVPLGERFSLQGAYGEQEADRVLLAIGGVAAGGIVLAVQPGQGRSGFGLSVEVSCRLRLGSEPFTGASSLYGPDLSLSGFGVLERVGVDATAEGLVHGESGLVEPRLAAAGDCVAERPRSLLEAIRSGCAAARALLA